MNQKKTVVVAVKASKDIPKTAMEWALTHVVQPGNCIKLLVVISPGKKHWGFQRFTTDCTTGNWRSQMGTLSDQKDYVTDSCSQLMHQLCQDYNSCKIHVKMKVVSGLTTGVVAAEAEKTQASWVILDKMLKAEAKYCMEQLQCNIVIMKGLEPKVLRLNLAQPVEAESDEIYPLLSKEEALLQNLEDTYDSLDSIQVPNVTPTSSPEHETQFSSTDIGTSSVSSSEAGPTTNLYSESTGVRKLSFPSAKDSEKEKFDGTNSDTGSDSMSSANFDQPWMLETSSLVTNRLLHMAESSQRVTDEILASASLTLQKRFSSTFHEKPTSKLLNHRLNMNSAWSLRETISLSKNSPAEPPPLCSICQNKTPIFGKPPRSFTYAELALATNGFSESNFLSEGGFGSVHRGMLPDGQVVAVKQHKAASSQGDLEFRSEVEVLSCAQHRNVVMLIGFCIEGGRRLLVYEYVCNGSLDSHIYSKSRTPLKWSARQKVAVGAARGLRYLHEECRVGCIVHRDMRPNNILITHDFEPLVGDFGLARCQPDGGLGEETRVIGTFGYLAPEYTQTGQITEKADVYSFGIVLLELVTGRKAVDLNRPKGEQCLTEWARPLLKKQAVKEMIDPRLRDEYSDREVYAMLHCASFCIRRDPDLRPRMSQVLRILEGDVMGSIS